MNVRFVLLFSLCLMIPLSAKILSPEGYKKNINKLRNDQLIQNLKGYINDLSDLAEGKRVELEPGIEKDIYALHMDSKYIKKMAKITIDEIAARLEKRGKRK